MILRVGVNAIDNIMIACVNIAQMNSGLAIDVFTLKQLTQTLVSCVAVRHHMQVVRLVGTVIRRVWENGETDGKVTCLRKRACLPGEQRGQTGQATAFFFEYEKVHKPSY